MVFENLRMEDYPSFLQLYNEAFPPEERREYKDETHLANFIKMKGGKFHAFSVKDGDLFLGFLSYWTFEGYTYVEHFAIIPQQRGKNLGSEMLHHLFKEVSPDVLLEVEKPDDDISRKRIRFYQKNGFKIREEFDYVQPPYSPDKKPVPMLLMTHGNVNLHNIESIKEMLAEVYNVRHEV
ncbi:MAG: GNAT family N-acetyltransferase [Muribaculaceae bacterium]|nr:GNAT family N-acetyltransferase [Muribaculaceae bacterium]MDE6533042.1 GNAT family N-acetyltransferase [Muribaculaceae bacterium]